MSQNRYEKGDLKVVGGYIHFEANLGENLPSLLIHPAISDLRIWGREFTSHTIGKSLIRFDTRGLGSSSAASSKYYPSDDIHALLDHLSVEKASLVAASNGGMAALDFALRFPERVEKLVLLASGIELFDPEGDSGLEETTEDFIQRFNGISSAWETNNKELSADRLISMFASSTSGDNLDLARKMILDNLTEIVTDESAQYQQYSITSEKLTDIAVPTLILVGTSDHPLFMWSTEKLKESIKGSRKVEIKNADHLINLSSPQEFDLNVGKFLGP